jgi:hypothetical protein
VKCDPSLECEFDLDGLPDGCTVHWNRLSRQGTYLGRPPRLVLGSEDEVFIELPNGISVECGVYKPPYDKVFRVDVVFAKWEWHSIEHAFCRDAAEAAAEIVRLANKYMDDSFLSLAREISRRRIHESAATPPASNPDAPAEQN